MVSICAFVVLFYVLASPLAALGWPAAALTGFLELFSLTPLLSPDRAGFLLAAVCSSFGGLSILCQTAAALDIPQGTAATRQRKALALLRLELGEGENV